MDHDLIQKYHKFLRNSSSLIICAIFSINLQILATKSAEVMGMVSTKLKKINHIFFKPLEEHYQLKSQNHTGALGI